MITGIENSIIAWFSDYTQLPDISPEMMKKANGQLLLQLKDGPKDVRDYVFSGKVRKSEFTLRIRVSNADTLTRLGAINILETAGLIYEASLPKLNGGVAVKSGIEDHPKLKRRSDNGDDEYEATYYILYWEDKS